MWLLLFMMLRIFFPDNKLLKIKNEINTSPKTISSQNNEASYSALRV